MTHSRFNENLHSKIFSITILIILVSWALFPFAIDSQAQETAPQIQTVPLQQVTPTPVPASQPAQETTAQIVPAGSGESLDITFKQMGAKRKTFSRVFEQEAYNFGLPPDVTPADGSFVRLDLDYVLATASFAPAQLEIVLNGELLQTVAFFQGQATNQVQIPIPTKLLRTFENKQLNSLELVFTTSLSCQEARLNTLTVNDTSLVHINYTPTNIPLDLSLYPKPIYLQNTVNSPALKIALPETVASIHAQSAAMMSAYLGSISDNKLPITATTGLDLATIQSTTNEHFAIIGTPDEQPLLRQLNLPVPILERQHEVWGVSPTEIAVNQPYTYSLSIKNTSSSPRNLQLISKFPDELNLTGCENCQRDTTGLIRWSLNSLAPNETQTVVGTLVLTGTNISKTTIDHTATLFDGSNIVNVKTLSSKIGLETTPPIEVPALDTPYFFAREGLAVAETDGVVQELFLPNGSTSIGIIVTGLTPEGLLKSARALSTRNPFPGARAGSNAIVQDIRPVTETLTVPPVRDITLASRNYKTEVIQNAQSGSASFLFTAPKGLRPTEDNYFALHFGYSTTLNSINGVATIFLNGLPIGSVDSTTTQQVITPLPVPPTSTPVITPATPAPNQTITPTPTPTLATPTSTPPPNIVRADNVGWISFPLPPLALQDEDNFLEVSLVSDILDPCATVDDGRYWFTIYNDSFIHLNYAGTLSPINLPIELGNYPLPFAGQKELDNLGIIIPDAPTVSDIQRLINLSRYLGTISNGQGFWPKVALGNENIEAWADYNLIAMGEPTRNSLITSVNRDLPQRFVPGTNQVEQVVNDVVYRLPADLNVGIVQQIFSPINRQRLLLVATGSTEQGMDWVVNGLTNNNLIFELFGNLGFIQDKNVTALNTLEKTAYEVRDELVKVAPEVTPETIVVTATPTPDVAPASEGEATATPAEVTQANATALETPAATPTMVLLPTPSARELAALEEVRTEPGWLNLLLMMSAGATVLTLILVLWRSRS